MVLGTIKIKCMKKIIFVLVIFILGQLQAQTGIGTSAPHASAKLEVSASDKGFLPPRVTLTSATDVATIANPATGLLVYNNGNNAGLAAGYYYWNGAVWTTIATAGGSGSVAAEFGAQFLTSNVAVTSPTPVDLITFTLPSAGTWEVISFMRAQGTPGFAAEFAVFDSSNVIVPNSEIICAFGESASTGTGVIRITTTGAAVYKLKGFASTQTFTAFTDHNGRTGVTWKKLSGNSAMTVINFGDVKTGFQSGDHNGWVRLDGRAKSLLSATQQAQATTLGIGTNLPDATNAFLVQNGRALGSIFSDNTKTIARANLPNVTLSGTTSVDGSHSHTIKVNSNGVTVVSGGTVTAMAEANNNWTAGATVSNANVINDSGNHNHSFTTSSINGGVTQTALDVTPRSLSVNTFVYLGF
jgi:hypothetical protein